jgi:hypothetical protein
MTEDKGQTVSVFCHLTSVICYPTPETIVIFAFSLELSAAVTEHL